MSTDQAPPTLEHVAKVAGVSRATVSRVVNGIRNVDPELREAVEKAIEQTGYVPNRAARSLVTRRAGAVALVVSEPSKHEDAFPGGVFADPFFGRVVSGVLRVLGPLDVSPVLMLVDSEKARAQLMNRLKQDRFDGVLLISIDPRDPLPGQLTEAGVPTVMFARPVRPTPISYVDVAHEDGARLAAEHLVARGCRQVATVSGPMDTPAGQDRLAGFRSTMARHGQAFVPSAEGDFTQVGGERATEALLAKEQFDGLFVANDLMAMGAIDVLRRHGKRVPEDVSVVGFDDSGAALGCRPQLTTIRQPVEDMAAEMARLVLEHIGGEGQRVTSVIFEPVLVVRASS
ncbi:LacI family DNA-binding transcriptional regulator [Kutzneria chonburiensis]|uniref:LacI family DNA-binding transcriptional regulator n=1 Tax=Kutzneria chonburiensis TaxID=1483604 RepID=A0ABV6N3T2_9PSEU|nr:LacI family DNA-binding transcriptional regulator [Kutzneria chonburiensis]